MLRELLLIVMAPDTTPTFETIRVACNYKLLVHVATNT